MFSIIDKVLGSGDCLDSKGIKVKLTLGLFIDGDNITEELEYKVKKDCKLIDLLKQLDKTGKYPKNYFAKLSNDGSVTLLINGKRYVFPDDKKVKLNDGDDITIISSIAGG